MSLAPMTQKPEIIMEFVEDNRYYAVQTEQGRHVCQCNDPLLATRVQVDPKVVLALRELLKIDRDYALETLKAILHK